jgi:hypothetical protein
MKEIESSRSGHAESDNLHHVLLSLGVLWNPKMFGKTSALEGIDPGPVHVTLYFVFFLARKSRLLITKRLNNFQCIYTEHKSERSFCLLDRTATHILENIWSINLH